MVAQTGNLDVAQLLLQSGANIAAQDNVSEVEYYLYDGRRGYFVCMNMAEPEHPSALGSKGGQIGCGPAAVAIRGQP